MLKIKPNIQGLDKLQKQIEEIEKYISFQGDTELNNFIKKRVWETLQRVMDQRLTGGTTNDEAISLYRASNHIKDTANGFILYNDATIMADTIKPENYPNQEFSIALAFEYGVGIDGEGTYDKGTSQFVPWEYNVHKYNWAWKYPTESGSKEYDTTYGYMGFEIYRYVADEVNKNLNKWVNEYMKGKVV